MKSDTPRTDAEWKRLEGQGLCISHKWHAQELERELNEAKERIKRLEEAGDRLLWMAPPGLKGSKAVCAKEAWAKAKEAKP